ncbi:uncharacterized protein LOC135155585 [Lytechinus pictus]|uniref:uncharacterized protein LOC135155585 n=1 Tax=Lytechinus pictus TaxID=7653 RepID=UPI0030B9E541
MQYCRLIFSVSHYFVCTCYFTIGEDIVLIPMHSIALSLFCKIKIGNGNRGNIDCSSVILAIRHGGFKRRRNLPFMRLTCQALHGKIKNLADHRKCTSSEDSSKNVDDRREHSKFSELFRLREENFELKREIQRLDHALQLAKDLDLDTGHSSPFLQNTRNPVNSRFCIDTCESGSTIPENSINSHDSTAKITKNAQFENGISNTRRADGNSTPNVRSGGNLFDRIGRIDSVPNHGETYNDATPLRRACTSTSDGRQNFSTNQVEEATGTRKETPPSIRSVRDDGVKCVRRHAQSMPEEKRTREDIRQQLLNDAFLVLQKIGGRYIKD